jgi:hypothetical protein
MVLLLSKLHLPCYDWFVLAASELYCCFWPHCVAAASRPQFSCSAYSFAFTAQMLPRGLFTDTHGSASSADMLTAGTDSCCTAAAVVDVWYTCVCVEQVSDVMERAPMDIWRTGEIKGCKIVFIGKQLQREVRVLLYTYTLHGV